jgi:ribosomal protein L24E
MNCSYCDKVIIPNKEGMIKVGQIRDLTYDIPFCSQKCYTKYLKKRKLK